MNKAFTLIELAIVVVILGLITVGVLGAQSLIESAKINSVTNELKQYKTAMLAFQLEYDAIPGDMDNAADYWPSAVNGNGDKIINTAEGNHFWLHLQYARILPHIDVNVSYGEVYSSYGKETLWKATTGLPRSRRARTAAVYGQRAQVTLTLTRHLGVANGEWGAALTPEDTKRVDEKIDDGHASKGFILGSNGRVLRADGSGANYGRGLGCTDAGTGSLPFDYTLSAGSTNYNLLEKLVTCRLHGIVQ
jgi:prepilin-type N-terminal cleavage/methylation domain-containing protein